MKLWNLALMASILAARIATAQQANEIVTAELAFAATAKAQTMKKAFLAYMDSTAVVFNRGKISNGFESWNKAPESDGKLLWHPAFYCLSQAGDLGFSTGPWEYRATLEDTVSGSGQFTTIWKKNSRGEWKFLADLGVSFPNTLLNKEPLRDAGQFISSTKNDTSAFAIENGFLEAFRTDRATAFGQYLHRNSWLNIDGIEPLQTTSVILTKLTGLPEGTSFKPVAGGMSLSRDLAYVYGFVDYGTKKENYLRVWGREREGWRIVLQVIRE